MARVTVTGAAGQIGYAILFRIASGQMLGPESPVADQLGVERDLRSNYKADYGKYHTNVDGVFAAGDVTKALAHQVATAVHEGNTAAADDFHAKSPDLEPV